MRRCVVAHAEAVRQIRGTRTDTIMVTLTYRADAEHSPRQVSRALHCVRQYCRRRGVPVAHQWVIETTQAGRPHYHVLLWVPRGFRFPKFDEAGWWPHGSTRIELARRAVGYLVKYASKGFDGKLPFGCRLFGTGGESQAAFARHRAGLPWWLNKAAAPGERVRRVAGGWIEVTTGRFFDSPYVVRFLRSASGNVILDVSERVRPDG